ncbi:MAG: hypothetical protein ACRDZ3_02655 [Acidimicrobiia bacterium]
MPTRRVIYRPDRDVGDAQQLLVRFGQDTDVAQALRLALISSRLYRALPGYEHGGAVCVSAFLIEDEADAQRMLSDVLWQSYGLSTAGAIRSFGYDVIGTDIEEDGELIPFSDRHVVLSSPPTPPAPGRTTSCLDRIGGPCGSTWRPSMSVPFVCSIPVVGRPTKAYDETCGNARPGR